MRQHIRHIDDVLPAIEGREEFKVIEKDGYTVIDYVFQVPDSFDDPMRRECRGIKFAPDGRLLARPFHKFFNVGEREETQPWRLETLGRPTAALKMDGSMVHPVVMPNGVFMMTRMGRSDQARMADHLMTTAMRNSIVELVGQGWTPVFEFTAPNNRIVVPYERAELTLLAVRHMESGDYVSREMLHLAAERFGVRPVEMLRFTHAGMDDFMAWVRGVVGIEGYVLRFRDGTWAKAKGEDYVLKHKSKEAIVLEKNALQLVLTNKVDDVISLLSEEDAARLQDYAAAVWGGVDLLAGVIGDIVRAGEHLDQKAFAVEHLPAHLPKGAHGIAFTVRAGRMQAREALVANILENCGTQSRVDSVRALFGGAVWRW